MTKKGNEEEYARFICARLAHAPEIKKLATQGGVEALIDRYAPQMFEFGKNLPNF